MKISAVFFLVIFSGTLALASALSPAQTAKATLANKTLSIKYSAPSVRGREGKLFSSTGQISHDPNYPVWRAGANAATTLHTESDIQIGDLSVPKGDYTLYVDIKDPSNWDLIVNKQTGQWGLKYDQSKDLGRVKMEMTKPSKMVETLKYSFLKQSNDQLKLELAWEDHVATVPVSLK